jgi:hypothetical protein
MKGILRGGRYPRFRDQPVAQACLPAAFLLTGGGIALLILSCYKRQGAAFLLLVGLTAGGFFYLERVVFPLVNPFKSGRFISEEVTSRIRPGEQLAVFGGFGTGPYNFYTGIIPIVELERKENLLTFLSSPERRFCLIKFRDLARLSNEEAAFVGHQIARRKVGNDDIVLISNQ